MKPGVKVTIANPVTVVPWTRTAKKLNRAQRRAKAARQHPKRKAHL